MSDHIVSMISVIVPCRNHAEDLRDCLAGFRSVKTQIPFEIIVVDSANDPKVLSVIQDSPEVKLIRSKENLDAASARNIGVCHSKGDFLAFIDADCIPTSNWLQVAWEALYQGAQIVGGPVSDASPLKPIAIADNILQFADLSKGRPAGSIDLLPGCNVAVRREAFQKVGGFPLRKNIEDVFFTSKIAERWPENCMYIPDMQIFHKGRGNLKDFWMHQFQFGYQRGFHGFRITKLQQLICRFSSVIPLIVFKRLIYVFQRIIKWNRERLFLYIALLPPILFGLTGWSIGFVRGCRAAVERGKKGKR